jgi:hypothetical protein
MRRLLVAFFVALLLLLLAVFPALAAAASADNARQNAIVLVPEQEQETQAQMGAPSALGGQEVTDTLDPNAPAFVPSEEWQEVLPGQGVPAGLHVSIDMQTGKKMARLLPPEERSGRLTRKEKRAAKLEALAPMLEGEGAGEQVHGEGRDENGRLKVLPDQLEVMQALWKKMMRDEADEMARALRALPGAAAEAQLATLDELEVLVHQCDNARDLVAMRGLEPLVELLDGFLPASALSESSQEAYEAEAAAAAAGSAEPNVSAPAPATGADASPEEVMPTPDERAAVAAAACRVLGSAAQNNEAVAAALASTPQGMQRLRGLLLPASAEGAPSWASVASEDALNRARRRAVFALGAVLRMVPAEAHRFIFEQAGAEVLVGLMDIGPRGGLVDKKAARKALLLLSDLLYSEIEAEASRLNPEPEQAQGEADGGSDAHGQPPRHEENGTGALPYRVTSLLRLVRVAQEQASMEALPVRQHLNSLGLAARLASQLSEASAPLSQVETAAETLLLLDAMGASLGPEAKSLARLSLERTINENTSEAEAGDEYFAGIVGLAQTLLSSLSSGGGVDGGGRHAEL